MPTNAISSTVAVSTVLQWILNWAFFLIIFGRGHWNRPSSPSREKSDLKPYQSAILILFFSECHWKVNHSFQFHCCHFMLSSLDSSACALTSLVEKWVQKPLRLVSRGWYYSPTHFSRLFHSHTSHTALPTCHVTQLTSLPESTKCIYYFKSSHIYFYNAYTNNKCWLQEKPHLVQYLCVFYCTVLNFSYFSINVWFLLLLKLAQ